MMNYIFKKYIWYIYVSLPACTKLDSRPVGSMKIRASRWYKLIFFDELTGKCGILSRIAWIPALHPVEAKLMQTDDPGFLHMTRQITQSDFFMKMRK